ncbi:MAG: zinc ribbon domain-containing protein [Clostridiales bacterium]|nr:MAG: zinc ribbon domain-containing protein [Clostridiales bacterium]
MHCGYCGRSVSSDSGTSRTGKVVRYYKCSGRKVDKKCDNTPIRKELLEQLVVEATYETLANPRLIDKLATLILNAHQQKMADASVINIIEGQLHDTEKALSNLIACMEKGIVSASTAKRLEELEQQKNRI